MNTAKKYFLFLSLGIAVIALTGCGGNFENTSGDTKQISNSGAITFMNNTEHDWGDINIKGGLVEHRFNFRNDGDKDLYLKSAKTSCMCTSARYNLPDGGISPKYGMHSKSNSWSGVVKPGETFSMDVWFDPMAHGPTATGVIRRDITLVTSANPDGDRVKSVSGNTEGSVVGLVVNGDVLSEEAYKAKHNS